MKKTFAILLILLAGMATQCLGAYYYPHYWLTGKITDSDGVGTANRQVVFYEQENYLMGGAYVSATPEAGSYLMNIGYSFPSYIPLVVGSNYYVFIVSDNRDDPKKGYGADPVKFKLSGQGVDVADLVLKKGGGLINGVVVVPPELGGPPPLIDTIKFGERIYQKGLVEKGQKFIVSTKPKIFATVKSESALKMDTLSISINAKGGPTPIYEHVVKEAEISNKGFSAKGVEAKEITSLSFIYNVPESQKLGEGVNTITFYAENQGGTTVETATVTVMAGPVAVIGEVLTYPSPFSPTKDKIETIQYTLSTDADIDVYLFSPTGEIVKKFINSATVNGGAAGVNKLTWDGRKPSGAICGNAIYSGAVVAHNEGKVLAKFKLTIVD